MKYHMYSGVTNEAPKKKAIIVGALASALMVGLMATTTLAASNNYCGSSANGCEAAAEAGAQCGTGAGSGAFGAFGQGNDFRGGADGRQTGLNNSALCGNRQGNL